MRAGNALHRIKFYAKVIARDTYGSSIDTYPIATITTRGEIRYVGGNKTLNNEERFYSKSMELTVRYQSEIVETMRVQIDDTNDLYAITYIEELGRKESLRLTLEKLADGLPATTIDPPTDLVATLDAECDIILTWVNNDNDDAVYIERSEDGITYTTIHHTDINTTTYTDTYLDELTRYWYRIRHIHYSQYSEYAAIDDATTSIYILPNIPTGLEVVTLSETVIQINWDDVGAEEYQIYVSTDSINYTQIGVNITANTISYTVEVGITYYFKVRSVRTEPLLYSSYSLVVSYISEPTLNQEIIDEIALFYGLIEDISDGKLYNTVTGSTDYITVTGSVGGYTFQCPETSDYINADTDYIWFKTNGDLRTVTESELISYDLQRTPIMYGDDSPNHIEGILILKSAIVLTEYQRDSMFNTLNLPILWDNSFNEFGHIKSNRFGQSLWIPEPIWEDELLTYIDELDTELSESQLNKLNTFIVSLKTGLSVSNLSDYFDVLVITGNETSETGLKNLVKDAHHGVIGGISPAFTQYEGFKNAANAGYINTNYNPATDAVNLTNTANSMGAYVRDDLAANNSASVMGNANFSRWMLRYTGDVVRGNSNGLAAVNALTSNAATKGFYVFNRSGNTVGVSKNGAAFNYVAGNAAAFSNYNYYVLGCNNAGTFAYGSNNQVACYFFSKLVTNEDVIIINNAIEAYMDSNSKGVQ